MKRIVVTGAGGFLGYRIVDELMRSTDYEILAVTSQMLKYESKLLLYPNRFKVIPSKKFDLINWKNTDCLLNLAFPMKADSVQMADGIKFVFDIIAAAAHNNVESIINVSSQSVYSQKRDAPAAESDLISLESPYAVGKYSTELMLNEVCANSISHTNVRLASLIGSDLNERIVNKLVAQAVDGKKLSINGGMQKFGFLDVRDAVSGLLALIRSDPKQWNEVYNLGTNKSWTLEDIAKCVCSVGKEKFGIDVFYELALSNDKKNTALNCNLFQKSFDWLPDYSIEDMIMGIYVAVLEERG